MVVEAGEIGLEAPARVAAQLHAREAGCGGATHECAGSDPVAAVAEDDLPVTELLGLDAFERDGEAFTARLVLKVDADVEGINAADDDAKLVAAFDDVRVHEAASGDLAAEGERLLVCLEASEDRLQPAHELHPAAGLVGARRPGRRRRKAQRRNGHGDEPDQHGKAKKTSGPHGAQSYQTPWRDDALLTNPLEPGAASAHFGLSRNKPFKVIMAAKRPDFERHGRNRTLRKPRPVERRSRQPGLSAFGEMRACANVRP